MKKFKFSIIMPIYNVEKYLEEAILSVVNQTIGFEDNIQLVLVNDETPDNSVSIIKKYQSLYPENVVFVDKKNGGVSSARNAGIEAATGEYIQCLDPDDMLSENTLEAVYQFFDEKKAEIDLVAIPIKMFEAMSGNHVLNRKFNQTRIIDIYDQYNLILMHAASTYVKREVAKQFKFDETCKIGEDAKYSTSIILESGRYGVVKDAAYMYRVREDGSSAIQTMEENGNWYNHTLERFSLDLLNITIEKLGFIPKYVQNIIMYDLKFKFRVLDCDSTPLTQEEYEEFKENIKKTLQFIDDDIIISTKFSQLHKKRALMMKNEYAGLNPFKVIEGKSNVYLMYKNTFLNKLTKEAVDVEIVNIKDDNLIIEGGFRSFAGIENFEIIAKVGNGQFPCKLFRRANEDSVSFDEITQKKYGFTLEIPKHFVTNNEISFYFKSDKSFVKLLTNTLRFSKLNKKEKTSYAVIEDLLYYIENNKLIFKKYSVKEHTKKEIEKMKFLMKKGKPGYKAVLFRTVHHALNTLKKKDIWIMHDRINKGDDNAQALLEYANQKNDNIKKYFIVRKNTDTYTTLKSNGYNVVGYGSYKHKLLYLLSDKIISSHIDEWVLNPFGSTIVYYQDLFKFKLVFLQHGVTMVDHSNWFNKFSKNIDKLITSSRLEYDSMLTNNYYYTEDEVKLTGMPRFDKLTSDSDKKILFMPTWRKHLVSTTRDSEGNRLYNDHFKDTEYFNKINEVIQDKQLMDLLEEHGYELYFFPHPDIRTQIKDFTPDNRVVIPNFDTSYQDLFKEGSILITDFSSVHFDFSYCKKPVLYYQFDEHHFEKSYFSFENNGFGPVVNEYNSLFKELKNLINNNSKMEEKYVQRVEDFYEFNDRNNCERVYDAITN